MSIADTNSKVWISASFDFPGVYSCRIPMSSVTSALGLPAPCPGTVRLALVRTSIEHFGLDNTREALFPIIRAMRIAIRPPKRVAFTTQRLRLYKAGGNTFHDRLEESIGYREYAHADGPMTVFVEVPTIHRATFCELFAAISYWGQASSLTQCLVVEHREPVRSECAVPIRKISSSQPLQPFLTSLASDFRDTDVEWGQVLPDPVREREGVLQIEIYVWPMIIIEQHANNRLLLRCSISE